MWRDTIAGLDSAATLADPVTEEDLRRADERLGQPLPAARRSLLLETDGVTDKYGVGLIWELDRIVADNLTFRRHPDFARLYMPFDPLLFFADAGNGEQFAVLSPPLDRNDVFAWNHEDDSRRWVAPDVETYLRWRDGRIVL